MDENSIREEAKTLKISNWHNKKIATLKQEVLDARVANEHGGKAPGTPVATEALAVPAPTEAPTPTPARVEQGASTPAPVAPVAPVQPMQPKTEAQIIKEEEIEGNKGFIEAAKEEQMYPFANKKGDRIGLYKKTSTEYDIAPGQKDSSYEFVRWSDEEVK